MKTKFVRFAFYIALSAVVAVPAAYAADPASPASPAPQPAVQQLPPPASPAASATADDFEAALFGTDAGVPAGAAASTVGTASFDTIAAQGEKAKTEYLAGGTVAVEAASTVEGTAKDYTVTSDANGKVFAKVTVPDYGSLYMSYLVSDSFAQGYGGESRAIPASNPLKPAFALSEFHYSFDISKVLFIRVGNQLIAWGPSRIWSPVDFINSQKQDSFAAVDSRSGKSGLRAHLPFPRANVFFFADFSDMTSTGFYGDPYKTINLGGRMDTAAGDFEFGLTGYGGRSEQGRAGADFSGRFLGATVYGEASYAPGYNDWDSRFEASLGFSRALGALKKWTVSSEGFFNSRGNDLTGYTVATITALPAIERAPLYQGKYYAFLSIAASELFSPSLSTTVSALSNLQDRSFLLKLAESFAFPRSVPFSLSIAYAAGGVEKEFTRFGGNGSVTATISTKIDF